MNKRKFLQLVPVETALKSFLEAIKYRIKESEEVPISAAVGQALCEDVRSTIRIPPYSTSIWDGYAVRSIDLKNASTTKPARLRIVGELFPNSLPSDIKIGYNEAAYVATGAPIPDGADAVVKLEEVTIDGRFVNVYRQVSKNESVSPPGEDIEKGIVLKRRHIIRPQDLNLLSSLGIKYVKILRKPRIAILSIGNELIEFDQYQAGMERKKADSHSLMLIHFVKELDWESVYLGVAPDDVEKIVEKLKLGLDTADIVLTIGGAFVGNKDETIKAIEAIDGNLIVHGVRMRPGKVVGLATVRGKPLIALPGLIVSLLANFYTFVIPTVQCICGLKLDDILPSIEASLLRDVKISSDADTFQLVKIERVDEGYIAEPIRGGSGLIRNVIEANGFIRIKAGQIIKRGDKVKVTLFSNKELKIISAHQA